MSIERIYYENGEHKSYNENGELIERSIYENGIKIKDIMV